MNEDRDLRDGVRLEMCYLKAVEEKEPTEEGPHGQREAFLIEGLEDDRLRPVLHWELLPEAAFPPQDLLLGEEPALHQILDVHSRRLLGAHTSEGGGTSAAPPDAEEEDFGDSVAIPGGGRWIGSVRTRGG